MRINLLLAAMLFAIMLAPTAWSVTLTWDRTIVDSVAGAPQVRAATIDAESWVYAYYDSANTQAKFAFTDDSGETFTTGVITATDQPDIRDVKVIDSDSWAVWYYEQFNDDFMFARTDNAGSTWSTPVTIESTGDVGSSSSACIISSTTYSALFSDVTNSQARYATTTDGGATWTTNAITTTFTATIRGALQCGSSSTWYWMATGAGSIIRIVKTADSGSTWSEFDPGIDSFTGSTFRGSSIKGTSANDLFLVVGFTTSGGTDLLVFTRTPDAGFSWSADVVIATDPAPSDNVYQLEVLNQPGFQRLVLAYHIDHASDPDELKFAQSDDYGATWTIETIDTGDDTPIRDSEIASEASNRYIIATVDAATIYSWESLGPQGVTEGPSLAPTESLSPLDIGEGLPGFARGFGFQTDGSQWLFGMILVLLGSFVGAILGFAMGGRRLSAILAVAFASGVMIFNTLTEVWPAWPIMALGMLATLMVYKRRTGA